MSLSDETEHRVWGKRLNARTGRIISLCAVVATVAVMAVPIGGLMGLVTAQDEEEKEKVLRVGFMQTVDSLNPFLGVTDAAYVFYGLVYDALHSVGEDFETVGNLALGWRVVDGIEPHGSAWEFDVTPNAKWHDREDFTVDDVVYTINLNSLGENYSVMWAYQPYAYFMKQAVRIDSDTVRVYFFNRVTGEPLPAAYAELVCIPILPKHKLSQMNPSDIGFNWPGYFTDSNPPIVGTGPFMATSSLASEFATGNKITLVKNPDYHWGPDKSQYLAFDKLVLHFYDDALAMKYALANNQLDAAQFPPETYRAIKQDVESGAMKNVTAYDGLKCTQYWTEIGINQAQAGPNPSRLDPIIRQAMAKATNKTYIVNNHYKGYAVEGSTLISPVNEIWHYKPTADELYDFDLEEAAAMLEAGGYRYPNPDAPLRVATSDSFAVQGGLVGAGTPLQYNMLIRREFPEETLIAKYLQEIWAEIGIGITYEILDEPTLATRVYGYAYDTMIWYWSADPDPNFMLFCQSEKAWYGWNDNLYYNPEYEENYMLSIAEFDFDQRKIYSDNCQRINYLDAYYIILAYPYQTYAWRDDTFSGWGDWEAHPARSLDAFWTGNPLYFDLTPLEPTEDDGGILLWVLVGAGIVAAAVVAAVVLMRKRGKKEEKEGGGSPLGE
jgi:peptide/nickel transport system substrate-binding protein